MAESEDNMVLIKTFYRGWVETTEERARRWCRRIKDGASNIPEEKKLDHINSRLKGLQFKSLEEI